MTLIFADANGFSASSAVKDSLTTEFRVYRTRGESGRRYTERKFAEGAERNVLLGHRQKFGGGPSLTCMSCGFTSDFFDLVGFDDRSSIAPFGIGSDES